MNNHCANSLIITGDLDQLSQLASDFDKGKLPLYTFRGQKIKFDIHLDNQNKQKTRFEISDTKYIHFLIQSGNNPIEKTVKALSKTYPYLFFRLAYSSFESDYYGCLKIKNEKIFEDNIWGIGYEFDEEGEMVIPDQYYKFCDQYYLTGIGVIDKQ